MTVGKGTGVLMSQLVGVTAESSCSENLLVVGGGVGNGQWATEDLIATLVRTKQPQSSTFLQVLPVATNERG